MKDVLWLPGSLVLILRGSLGFLYLARLEVI